MNPDKQPVKPFENPVKAAEINPVLLAKIRERLEQREKVEIGSIRRVA